MTDIILDSLRQVRALIADEAHWCQYAWARTASGKDVQFDSPAACQWCFDGALCKVTGVKMMYGDRDDTIGTFDTSTTLHYTTVNTYINTRAHNKYGHYLLYVNDQLGHFAVLDLIDQCIIEREIEVNQQELPL